jgi:uncharacterized protein
VSGERDLPTLLRALRPELHPHEYVFTTVDERPDGVRAVASVEEDEGTTLILRRTEADAAGLSYEYVAAWITLKVHSALAAVGLTAVVAAALAGAGLSCNVVAGYYHDHLFVAYADRERAMEVLAGLTGYGGAGRSG